MNGLAICEKLPVFLPRCFRAQLGKTGDFVTGPRPCLKIGWQAKVPGAHLARGPGAQQLPQQDQLTGVVGVMIGHQQSFAQQRLAVTVRNPSK